jgi:cytochrome c peroxidase
LKGDQNAISEKAKHGYQLFKSYGCISCHQGKNVGGNMFQVFGVINNYFLARGNITKSDYGRYNVTGNETDRYSFKVPSLRMAKYTPPYLHDGSQATLRDVVNIMFRHQLGREAPDEDKEAIVSFIETLAGEHEEMK